VKRLLLAASVLLAGLATLEAQQEQVLEVQQSSGFVEALIGDLGWRQAVIGRPLPAGSVVTSWLGASAKMGYRDTVVSIEQLTHFTVLAVEPALVRLSVQSGSVRVDCPTTAYEIEFRGMVIRVEKGSAVLNDGLLSAEAGSVVVTGAQDGPLPVASGTSINLLAVDFGPVFRSAVPDAF
jgi:hypothetical protein